MKILIVEDEEALSRVLAEKFMNERFDVRVVKNGKDAYAEAKKFMPDIIALDILLPGKNGFDILKEIRQDDDLRSVPVIMLSNLDSDEDIKRSLSLGAQDYFVKSQHMIKEIVEKVKEYTTKGI